MRLARMRIRNFRCFHEEIAIDFNDLTALIGKNDAGKSTIMDALDIFLNDTLPDKHDATKNGIGRDLTIICEFDHLPGDVIIDEAIPTTLKDEYLLNSNGNLELHKTYSGHLLAPKCTEIAAFAVHPTANHVKDLLQLKNADLKKRAQELKIDVSDIDQKVNSQLRSKIRAHIKDLNLAECGVPLTEDNAKDVWSGLRRYVPVFAIFRADRSSTDQDPEAQDPLKAAVKEALKTKESELNKIVSYIESEVKKIAQSTLEKIREMDPALASKLNPQFAVSKWESLFKVSITGDEDIPINKRGSGIRRLILLNFFRAKADQYTKESGRDSVIFGIEEPETSQHPNNQRMLLRVLSELSEESQVIISTHTPVLARALPNKYIRFINIMPNDKREILCGSETTNRLFSESLGVLPDHNVKLFVGLEGSHDIDFLQNVSSALVSKKLTAILDLLKLELDGKVIFFPLGGSNLVLWTTRLEKLNRPEFHLCDRDIIPPNKPKYQDHVDAINKRTACKAYLTNKKELENYLHKDAIIAAYKQHGITITLTKNFGDFDDVPLEVAKLVHDASGTATTWAELKNERREDKISNAKKILNRVATKYMNIDKLKEIDPKNELLGWLAEMHTLFSSVK
jgi:energy-coupling factor transporter ATP-binding protein EcfA2